MNLAKYVTHKIDLSSKFKNTRYFYKKNYYTLQKSGISYYDIPDFFIFLCLIFDFMQLPILANDF